MKMWKRVLAAALCVLLGVSCLPDLSTFAVGYVQAKIEEITAVAGAPGVDADAEPDAGSDVVYDALLSKEPEAEPEPKDWTGYTPISTAQQLSDIRNDLGGKYYLTCDIVFTEADFAEDGDFYNDGKGWIPLGDSSHPFFGTFDGDGYTIQNLFVNVAISDTDVYAGLFGYVQNGIIRNLGLVDSDITATAGFSRTAYAGGIVGYISSGSVSECYNTGSVSATSSDASAYAGGIAGYGGTFSECYNTGSVSASATVFFYLPPAYAGGIAGYGGTFSECYNTGSVSASGSADAGGIAGCVDGGTISECYNTGSVSASGSADVGGIAGYLYGSATISECYNTGSVSATSSERHAYAGGIAGRGETISECYNTGSVSATSSDASAYAGGIAGDISAGSVSECYYLDNCAKGVGYGTDYAVKCTPEQMKQQNTFAGFDFDSIWTMGDGNEYPLPTLKGVSHYEDENVTEFAGGDGTLFHPYLISTKEQLNNVRKYLGANFKLLNNIVFSAEDFAESGSFYNDGAGWIPLGDSSHPFFGTLDGDGYTIQNLFVHVTRLDTLDTDVYAAGLFGYVQNGIIRNLGLVDSDITATAYDAYAGGIAGRLYGSAAISECYNTGRVYASGSYMSYAGGIAGDGGTISECYNMGSVSASGYYSYAGGIAGAGGTISKCYNTGSVSASGSFDVYAGGIAGAGKTISECYNTGSVSASGSFDVYAGGIAGAGGTISECYNTGSVSASGPHDGYYAGGIAGYISSGSVSECYCLDNCAKGVGYGTDSAVKCTLEQMKQQNTFAGFDFDLIWTMGDGNEYPFPTLKDVPHYEEHNENVTEFASGDGTLFHPYLISTKEQLNNVRKYLGANFKLLNNIVFSAEDFAESGAFYNDGAGWIPIGDSRHPVFGTFDGDGYTIQNLVVHAEGNTTIYAGLFGYVKNGIIRNLGLVDSDITATAGSSRTAYAGGIVGYISSGSISECYNTGSVSASGYYSSNAGGIAGYISYGSVSECYNTGSVSASGSFDVYAGGIAGAGGTISECYNTGSVSASGPHDGYYAGGIAGYISSGSVSECYCLDNCAKGVGYGTGSAVKCTLEQMKNPATFVGFDFDSVWTMAGNEEYPFPELQKVEMIFRRDIASVEIATQPKTSYIEGQPFDDSTMTLKVSYYDFSTEIITQGWSINGYKPDTVGSQTVTVTYQDFTVQIKVTVAKKQLVHIAVTQQPSQTEYVVGDSFNDKGMELTLYYDNETQTVVDSGWDLPDYDFSEPGQIEVKITYQGKQTTLTVTVRPAAPGAPVVAFMTNTSVTLVATEGYEYRMDDGQWQKEPVFQGLLPNSVHKFYQRVAATAAAQASDSGEALSVTIPAYILGDINGDGVADNMDALAILLHEAGKTKLEGDALTCADVNADGMVDNRDAVQILQLDAGVISGF